MNELRSQLEFAIMSCPQCETRIILRGSEQPSLPKPLVAKCPKCQTAMVPVGSDSPHKPFTAAAETQTTDEGTVFRLVLPDPVLRNAREFAIMVCPQCENKQLLLGRENASVPLVDKCSQCGADMVPFIPTGVSAILRLPCQ